MVNKVTFVGFRGAIALPSICHWFEKNLFSSF